MLASLAMARRRDRDEPPDILSPEELKALRHNLAHLSPDGVRQICGSTAPANGHW
ncbi:MAG: hypothetical protein ABSB87_04260 [Terriglobales bacterium]